MHPAFAAGFLRVGYCHFVGFEVRAKLLARQYQGIGELLYKRVVQLGTR